jgi:hypothetical protein
MGTEWRRVKLLGVIAFVIGGIFAVVPAISLATNFTASSYPATFTGTSSGQEFWLEAGKVECSSTHFTGTLSAPSSSVTITPFYGSCKAFGLSSASVSMNGCDYTFTTFGTWSINCSSGSILITAFNCKVTIGAQAGLAPLSLANASGGLWMGPETGSLTYTVTQDGLACPFNGTGARTGGDYVSVVDMFVSAPGKSIDIG